MRKVVDTVPVRSCRSIGAVTTLPWTVMRVSFIGAPWGFAAALRRLHPPSPGAGGPAGLVTHPVDSTPPAGEAVDNATTSTRTRWCPAISRRRPRDALGSHGGAPAPRRGG